MIKPSTPGGAGVLVLALALLLGAAPAVAAGDDGFEPPATTLVDDVRQARTPSGTPALVDWVASHEFTRVASQGEWLPAERIDRARHPEAFDGVWGQSGTVGAWLAPAGTRQFFPEVDLVESAWYRNRMSPWESDEVLAEPGDRVEVAAGVLPYGPLLAWDRERAAGADGELGWEVATSHRELSASYGGVEATMDAVFVRAHVVARGGDVDARPASVDLPPLEIDLPRSYPTRPFAATSNVTLFAPYVQYVKDARLAVAPPAGKAVLRASVQGYFPEARLHTTPGGARIPDWFVPVNAIILVVPDAGLPVEARAVTSMAAGGVVIPADGGPSLSVPPGGHAVLGPSGLTVEHAGASPEPPAGGGWLLDDAGASPEPPAGGGWLLDDAEAAAAVGHALAEPLTLRSQRGGYQLTLDPDYRGTGLLAVRDVGWQPHPAPYAEAMSVPAVVVDGQVVPLTRERLVDLAVAPSYLSTWIRSVGWSQDEAVLRLRMSEGRIFDPGLTVQAAYDLGGDVYATVTYELGPYPLYPGGALWTAVEVRALSGEPLESSVLRYAELPAGEGVLRNAGEDQPVEFTSGNTTVSVGGRQLTHGAGTLTVVRAPAPLLEQPDPDPQVPIAGQRVALAFVSRTSDPVQVASLWGRASLGAAPEPPAGDPPPLGQPCGEPQVVGDSVLAHPHADVDAAWFDADERSLYVNLRLAAVPEAAPPTGGYLYRIHWRYEHRSRYAAALLSPSGAWSFEAGSYSPQLGYIPRPGAAGGEVQPGPDGVIRVTVPRGLFGYVRDGELLRDTGVHAYQLVSSAWVRVAQAPAGSAVEFGSGGDYVVGTC